ncbi:MAG TPA: zinc-binding alcohol dehydrogenase [Sphaerochaeta sp.]|nr:zinc-binding alcohol dehydrogenase [Sphaerochaeta sp.]
MKTKRLQAFEKGQVKLVEEKLPELGADEILLKTIFSTISPGTELAWINHMENTPGIYPYYPGYSAVAQVKGTGKNVNNLQLGDVVVANITHDSYAITKADKVTLVDSDMDLQEVSAFRLASISLQGVRKAGIQIGDNVAVIGLGAIGNLAAQLAHVAGAGAVIGFDTVDWRRDLAAECGVVHLESDSSDEKFHNKFDVVFEATGVPAVINTALEMVKPLGTVILLGSTRGLTDAVNFYKNVHRKGVTVVGAHEMHRAKSEGDGVCHFRSHKYDEATIIKLLQAKRICIKPLINAVVKPNKAQDIYEKLLSREDHLILASFDWR